MQGERSLVEVLKFCSPKDLLQHCDLVCKQWNRLSNEDEVWLAAMETIGRGEERIESSAKSQYRAHLSQRLFPVVLSSKIFYYSPLTDRMEEHQLQREIDIDHTSGWTWLPLNRVMCAGNEKSKKAYLIHPRDYSVENLPEMTQVRGWFAMLYYNEDVYVFGGFYSHLKFTDRCERFNLRSNTWNPLPSMSRVRSSFNACRWKDTIFVAGGWDNPEVEYLDLLTLQFQTLALNLVATGRTLCWILGDTLVILQDKEVIWWDIVKQRRTNTERVKGALQTYVWTNAPPMEWEGKLYFLMWEDGQGYSFDQQTHDTKQVFPSVFPSQYF